MIFINEKIYFVSLLFQKAKGCDQHEKQTTYHVREQFSFEALEKIEKKSCYFLQTQTASKLHLSHHLVLLTSLQVPPIFTSMLDCLHTSPVSPLRSIHFISRFHPFLFFLPPCSTASILYLSHHLDLLTSLQVPPIFFTSMLNCFHTLPVSPFRSTHFISRFHPFTMLDYFHTLPVSLLKAKGCGFNTQVPPTLLL